MVEDTKSRKTYILVVNWNNWKATVECLESVFLNSYPDYQVIVIDNGSSDGSLEKIEAWARGEIEVGSSLISSNPGIKPIPYLVYDRASAESGGSSTDEVRLYPLLRAGVPHPLILVRAGNNLGYAGGNNIGIRYALRRGDALYVWILNNDTVVDREALSAMITDIETDAQVGMAGSRLLYYDRTHILQAAGGCRLTPWLGNTRLIANNREDSPEWDRPLMPDYICGASLMVKKEVIDKIGLLDESHFLYWEDADWGERARKWQYRLLYSPASKVWHKEGGTSGRTTDLSDYYWVRNGLAFMKKFYPAFLPLALAAYAVKYTVVRAVRRQPLNFVAFIGGVRDFFAGRRGK